MNRYVMILKALWWMSFLSYQPYETSRSVLTKTVQLQTTLSSAESVFSLLQTLSLNTLRDVKTADAKQTNNRSADCLQRLQRDSVKCGCGRRMRTADGRCGRRTDEKKTKKLKKNYMKNNKLIIKIVGL